MRKHVAWYTKGLKGSAKLREEINRVESYQELEELLFQRLQEKKFRDFGKQLENRMEKVRKKAVLKAFHTLRRSDL